MGRLTGLDIRMASFRRSRLRAGYRRDAVDDYLIVLAGQIDDYRDELDATRDELASISERADVVVEESHAVLESAREVADVTIAKALDRADEVTARAERSAAELHREAREERGSALDETKGQAAALVSDAKGQAAEIVSDARGQAAGMLTGARERRDELERAQAEAEVKLAYAEQRLADRAEALTAEARRLDELASWLVDSDPLGAKPRLTDSDSEGLKESNENPAFRRAFRVVHEE